MVTKDTLMTALQIASPLAFSIVKIVNASSKSVESASHKSASDLSEEIQKQTMNMQFAQQQARVEQELAIARRIDNAEHVEIEEFYDTNGKGGVGVDISTEKKAIGAFVEGRVVTKRVYHFRGRNPLDLQNFDQPLES